MKLSAVLALGVLFLSGFDAALAEVAASRTILPIGAKVSAKLSVRDSVDSLSEADLDQTLRLLKESYQKPEALSGIEMKRALIQGIMQRLAPGIEIIKELPVPSGDVSPFRAEVLANRIGYARLGSINPKNLGSLDLALVDFEAKKIGSMVLDLRATPPGMDFASVANICQRFCPKGLTLFSIKRSSQKDQIFSTIADPSYRGTLALLVDSSNAGSTEIIASVLRTHAKAMVIGSLTQGQIAEFTDLPLIGGQFLHLAVAEVCLPEKFWAFPRGIKPDIVVDVSRELTIELLQREMENGVSEWVSDIERPRMNEASLVAGTNPELDALQLAQKTKRERHPPPLKDVVLQRALDFMIALKVYDKGHQD
jgi:hypothetical protein